MVECKECGKRVTTITLRVPMGHRDADGNLIHRPPGYVRLSVKHIREWLSGLKPGHDLGNTLTLDGNLRLTHKRVPVSKPVKPDRKHKIHDALSRFRRPSFTRLRAWLTVNPERPIYVMLVVVALPLAVWLILNLLPRVLG